MSPVTSLFLVFKRNRFSKLEMFEKLTSGNFGAISDFILSTSVLLTPFYFDNEVFIVGFDLFPCVPFHVYIKILALDQCYSETAKFPLFVFIDLV